MARNVSESLLAAATETFKVASQVAETLELVGTYEDNATTIQIISHNIEVLALKSRGRHSNRQGPVAINRRSLCRGQRTTNA